MSLRVPGVDRVSSWSCLWECEELIVWVLGHVSESARSWTFEFLVMSLRVSGVERVSSWSCLWRPNHYIYHAVLTLKSLKYTLLLPFILEIVSRNRFITKFFLTILSFSMLKNVFIVGGSATWRKWSDGCASHWWQRWTASCRDSFRSTRDRLV